MCSLLYPCLHFDVAVEPAAMANEECHRRRHGLGWVPVGKTVDPWTHCIVWSLLGDIVHDTSAGEPQQW